MVRGPEHISIAHRPPDPKTQERESCIADIASLHRRFSCEEEEARVRWSARGFLIEVLGRYFRLTGFGLALADFSAGQVVDESQVASHCSKLVLGRDIDERGVFDPDDIVDSFVSTNVLRAELSELLPTPRTTDATLCGVSLDDSERASSVGPHSRSDLVLNIHPRVVLRNVGASDRASIEDCTVPPTHQSY